MHVGVAWFLGVSAVLFGIGLYGVFTRRSPIILLLSVEIMLNASNLALISVARYWGQQSVQVFALVVMAVWSVATGTYFAFRDNVLTRLIGRQAEMQFAYEDRIAELRAQVDRIMSRQMLDQEQFEKKLNGLLQRQSTLEQRASALAGDSWKWLVGM